MRYQVQSNQTPQKIEEEWKKVFFVKVRIQFLTVILVSERSKRSKCWFLL